MPWDILELDADTATRRDVKRAYARKLKTTRPDKDPAGFQELREAYEAVMMELDWRDSRDSPAPFPSEPDEHKYDPAPASIREGDTPREASGNHDPLRAEAIPETDAGATEIEAAFAKAEQAIGNREDVAEAMRTLERALYNNPDQSTAWGQAVARLIDEHPDEAKLRLRPETILFELEHDGFFATIAVICRLERHGERNRLDSLATLLRTNLPRISTAGGGEALARLACASALWNPMLTKTLADMAYKLLPIQSRDNSMGMIERDTVVGSLLREISGRWRYFWAERIREPYRPWDWDNGESRAALLHLQQEVPAAWTGFELVLDLIPEQAASAIERKRSRTPDLQPACGPTATPTRSDEPQAVHSTYRQTQSSGSGTNWAIWLAVFLLIKCAVIASHCSTGSGISRTPTVPPPPRLDVSPLEPPYRSNPRQLINDRSFLERTRRSPGSTPGLPGREPPPGPSLPPVPEEPWQP